jgi:uracil-DNA glycosylase
MQNRFDTLPAYTSCISLLLRIYSKTFSLSFVIMTSFLPEPSPPEPSLIPASSALESSYASLAQSIVACVACPLRTTCLAPIPGDGNPHASIMVVGEAPGATEDTLGIPFCGRSGKLITSLLESIGLYRTTHYYITNIVKCRPPENRDPTPSEIATCSSHLHAQIDLLSPRLIIALGRFSFNYLVPHKPISTAHGSYFRIYHIQ